MAWYKCIQSNQYDGNEAFIAGRFYNLTPTPPVSFFEDAPAGYGNNSEVPTDDKIDGYTSRDGVFVFDQPVELGDVSLESITFDTSQTGGASEGELAWSSEEETLTLGMPGGNAALQLGMEMYVPRRVQNKTGSPMLNGDLVYISGGSGNNAYVTKAQADAQATALGVVAMLTEDLANNAKGYATTTGIVREIDTSSYTIGDKLYLSADTAGAFTNIQPAHPNYSICIGTVFRVHANEGSVIVRVDRAVVAHNIAGGEDAVWDDLKFPFTSTRQGANTKPDFDTTNIGLLFPQNNAGEITYAVGQLPHEWLIGSSIRPHIHFIQDEATLPTFKMDYRIYENGAAVPGSFTTLSTADGTQGVFTYTSGTMLQIASFPMIDMSAITAISAIIDIKIYRDDNDVTGDVLTKEFDIHYQIDSLGSRAEFTKN